MGETDKKYSVLIVDDEKTNIAVLTSILSGDYDIIVARDGCDAIEVANEYMPDIILLDIVMPVMDGYEVINTLKANEKTADIPVIFVTGLSDNKEEERGLALGAADYISKPFSPAIVKLRVRNQIEILRHIHTIEHLSLTDQLTGINNRRSFDHLMSAEWKKSKRERLPISLLMLDIDRFKNYNDTHGHQQGDNALQTVAKAFTQTLKRPGDFAARWGGEEFIVLLPNTDSRGALEIAEQIRRHIENMDVFCNEGQAAAKITLSVGVNTWTQGHCTIDAFITGADKALYAAKNGGRNMACHFATHC